MIKLFKQNKMFRVYLTYQFFSSIGGAMFSMFILLSVHLLYQNSLFTGIAGFLMAAPRIVSFAVGPVIDRRNKITIMRLTTFLEFLVLAFLAFTPLQEHLGVLFMFAVIFAYNIAALFESPAGIALLPHIVREDEIIEANSLINIIAMAGGIVIGAVLFTSLAGEVNFSFLYGFSAVFIALAFIFSLFLKNNTMFPNKPVVKKGIKETKPSNYINDLKEGAKFIRRSILLITTFAVVAMDFIGEIAYVNRPMFLEYHTGAQGYVLFTLMMLIGGVAASFLVGKLGNKYTIGKLIFMLFIFAGMLRVVFALVVPLNLIGALLTTIIYAAIIIAIDIIFSSLNQKIPQKNIVGRVSTISTTLVAVSVALGALAGGFLGNIVSDAGHVFIYQGIGLAAIGIFVVFTPSVRKLPKMNEIGKVDSL